MKKSRFLSRLCPGIALILFFQNSYATNITYDIQNIAGNTWEYAYTVVNDALSVDIEEFTVYFDLGLYENLVVTSIPADWDPLVIQPNPLVPDDGLYDALALVSGIAPGGSLGGFGVQFDFLGAGMPGGLLFDVVDPDTYASLDSGVTQSSTVPEPASEPAVVWLLCSGLLGLVGMTRKQRLILKHQ